MAQDAVERGRDGAEPEAAAPTAGPRVTGVEPGPDPDLGDERDLPQETAPADGAAREAAALPHEHGSMDISHHEETYQGFVRLAMRAAIAIVVVLLLLALFNA
jgi:hypothetical protein